MRVLVCGDRNWTNVNSIRRELSKLPDDTIIIHGGAKGADTIVGRVAEELGFDVVVYNAQWNKYGKYAGPKRNQMMLQDGKPDLVLAFHEDIYKSKGTKDMIKRSQNAGIVVKLFDK